MYKDAKGNNMTLNISVSNTKNSAIDFFQNGMCREFQVENIEDMSSCCLQLTHPVTNRSRNGQWTM